MVGGRAGGAGRGGAGGEAGDAGDGSLDEDVVAAIEVVREAEAAAELQGDESVDGAAQHPDRVDEGVVGEAEAAQDAREHPDRLLRPCHELGVGRVGRVRRDLRGRIPPGMLPAEVAECRCGRADGVRARTADRRPAQHGGQVAEGLRRHEPPQVVERRHVLVQAGDRHAGAARDGREGQPVESRRTALVDDVERDRGHCCPGEAGPRHAQPRPSRPSSAAPRGTREFPAG